MDLYFYLIPIAVLLGLYTSYSDYKYKKIRNYVLLSALISFLVVIVAFGFKFNYNDNVGPYFLQYTISVVFMFFISVLLWYLDYWSAADAKLVSVFSLAITPGLIRYNYSNLYVVNFFYNIILVHMIYLIVKGFSFKDLSYNKKLFFETKNLSSYLFTFLIVYSFSFLSRFILKIIGNPIDSFYLTLLFFMFVVSYLRKTKKMVEILFILAIFRTIFDWQQVITFDFWFRIIKMFLFISLIRLIFDFFSFSLSRRVDFSDLKKGMFLAQELKIDRGNKQISFLKLIKYNSQKGLTSENLKLIKRYSNDIKNKKILISEKDFFAPFVFLGYLLTLLIRTNLITYLRVIFKF